MDDNTYIEKEDLPQPAIPPKGEGKKVKEGKRSDKSKEAKKSAFTQLLNGDFLTKEFVLNNLNYIFFIMFLLLLIVGKGYYGKQLSKDIDTTQTQLDELTADYVEAKAKLEERTRRYKLVEKLEPLGLVESQNKTKVIRIKRKTD
jgi:hypothetical protein